MTRSPTLSYDDLPPGSDIRRVYDRDTVQITVPAGRVPAAVAKQTAYDALASGAISSWALLLLAFVIFMMGLRINRISGVLVIWAWAFFAIFCSALVLLVSWVRYGTMIDAIRAGRRQFTVIAASPQRVLIETIGPFGTSSYDIPRADLVEVTITRGAMKDDLQRTQRLRCIELRLVNDERIRLLPGREPRELHWVAAALK